MNTIESPAPIVSFQWGGRADMLTLQRRLFDRGIHIHYSNYIGAGPEGILRCAVFPTTHGRTSMRSSKLYARDQIVCSFSDFRTNG